MRFTVNKSQPPGKRQRKPDRRDCSPHLRSRPTDRHTFDTLDQIAERANVFVLVQSGAFVLDVSWPAEWDEYHTPNTVLIPLDQLYNRLNELPKDREILVVSRSQTSSQQARDLLLSAGIKAVSMAGSLSEWYAKGYPIEGAPAQ